MARFDGKAFGERLSALQKQKGVTNEELGRRARISLRSVERLRSGAIKRPPKQDTLERLVKALDTSADVLLGKAPLPETMDREKFLAEEGFTYFTLRLRGHQRNAVALTALRYGVTPTFVFELAPLLFDTLARLSLRDRKEAIEEIRRRQAAVEEMRARARHLPTLATAPHNAHWDAIAAEEEAIGDNDLFADCVRDDKSLESYWLDGDFDAPNPFQAFLARLADEAGGGAEVEEVERNVEPRFTILRDEALKFAGGDEDLAESILDGSVLLSDMPKELLAEARMDDRLVWLREKREEVARKAEETWERLGLDRLITVSVPQPDSKPEEE